ncbi:quinone oxidoreductase family protein [Paenibacillus nasutitermitis]|uniref:NADPH:quinone reductase n=1 Tax=Paenibacillus nasutitermitis TaxID=1652958 RepID=A0A916Z7R3_9BACL|nr:NADP-dependent oxidoreductase [Paenibacillus nasutitermitis]GGD79260.1 NADPH:quinone reductase [Paenibacillus nasutitermitis]
MNAKMDTMKAAVLNRFGGPEELVMQKIELPEIGPEDVLIRVEYAGVGEWDAFERQGGYAAMHGIEPRFPYVLGSEGAGTVAVTGEKVVEFNIGDNVFAPAFLNPRGGFYAEYASVPAKYASLIPDGMTAQEAAVISGVGITALRGLEDVLQLKQGESIIIIGASGGVGHLAVQIAKQKGARVLAVASGEDGVDQIKKLGSDAVINGRVEDIAQAAMKFAPQGLDAALFTAGGDSVHAAMKCIRPGGRIAYPNGIHPEPQAHDGIEAYGYNGEPDPDIISRFYSYLVNHQITALVSRTFLLEEAHDAHVSLNDHYIGKLCLKVNAD